MPICDPTGIEFYDFVRQRMMKLVTDGPWKDWIVYRHPDGQWVTLRPATEDDIEQIIGGENEKGISRLVSRMDKIG